MTQTLRFSGFLMPGDVKSDTHVAPLALAQPPAPFDSRILASIPRKRRFFGPFLGLIWVRLGSKASSFLAPKNANSFLFNKSLGSFPLFSIFFHFPRLFPPLPSPPRLTLPHPQPLAGALLRQPK
jgi:hypothetical protein